MPNPKSMKVKPATVINAIHKYNGVRTRVAEALGISRSTLHDYTKKNPEIAQAFEDVDNTVLDSVESRLIFFTQGFIPGRDGTKQAVPLPLQLDALKFFLRTKGKSRGYSERIEADVKTSEPISINLGLPDTWG